MANGAKSVKPGQESGLEVTQLKVCPLCGGLNLEANHECFVCGWHGQWERNLSTVRAALELAVRRYGRLELRHVTDARACPESPARNPLNFRARLRAVWERLVSNLRRR